MTLSSQMCMLSNKKNTRKLEDICIYPDVKKHQHDKHTYYQLMNINKTVSSYAMNQILEGEGEIKNTEFDVTKIPAL